MTSRKIQGGPLVPVHIGSLESDLSQAGIPVSVPDGLIVSLGQHAYDAFGRQRVSEPFTLFESHHEYTASTLYWLQEITGGASITHQPNQSSLKLTAGTASGDKAISQTKRYYRYQPGKSQVVKLTGVLGYAKGNTRQRVGLFDDRNGIFFEQTTDGLFVVERSYTSGAAVDTRTAQAAWNQDKMDGTGSSGYNVNPSKSQIFFIDFQWLGVGEVRYGFVINGDLVYCHHAHHANILDKVYMTTPHLPARYEIENTGATPSSTDMYQICVEIESEGGVQEQAQVFAHGNGATTKSVSNTLIPLISIRPGVEFPSGSGSGLPNRVPVIPLVADIFSEDSPMYYQVLLNPSLTNPNWQNFNTSHSGVQYDVSASALSGGLVIGGGYVAAAKNAATLARLSVDSKYALTQNFGSTSGDILTVAGVRVGVSNTDVGAVITWKELY